MSLHLCLRVFVLAAAVLLPGRILAASTGDVLTIKRATVGFGNKFKTGFWQPVRLTVVAGAHGAKGRLELAVPDGDQAPVAYRDASRGEINLAADEETTLLLYCKSGPVAAPISVRLMEDGAPIWSQVIPSPTGLRSTQEFVVGLGPAVGLEDAAATIRRRTDSAIDVARAASALELPDRWWGFDGVDTLVLTTSDPKIMADLTKDQREAIVRWVLLGGKIVFCVGDRGADIVAADSPWTPLIPGELAEVEPLRERSGLENFTGWHLPFEDEQFQRNRPRITRLKNIRGDVLVNEASGGGGRPLAIHAPAGLGRVIFVGIDLDHRSLKDWKGKTRFVASLLQHMALERGEASDREARASIRQLGYDDLIGQLRAALDQFPGVQLINFTTVSVLTIAYLLLIGPGDYLLLSRLALPRQVTWLTFPMVAAAAIAVAIVGDHQVHGSRLKVNQVEIVDFDVASQLVRGTSWWHVYSPTTRRYDTDLKLALPERMVASSASGWLVWQGFPGDSLGGLESRQPALFHREPYDVTAPGPKPSVEGLTIQTVSSKSLSSCWWSEVTLPSESKLTIDRYGLLAGEFRLPLAVSLTDCMLAHGEKLYRIGPLSGGQRVDIADLAALDLEARLTQRRIEQTKDVPTPWEQDAVDIPRIVQMLMFYDAARGINYTGLTHRYQPRIDLSQHVRLGSAVLMGRSEVPVARLAAGDAPLAAAADTTSYTWYRILLPVKR